MLYVSVKEAYGHETVETKEEPVRDIGYAWIYQKDRITEGVLKEVRQKDVVSLLFPYEPVSVAVGEIGGSMRSTSTEFLLKLETDTYYDVVVEVKGEDSENNTVIKSKKAKIKAI